MPFQISPINHNFDKTHYPTRNVSPIAKQKTVVDFFRNKFNNSIDQPNF